MDNQEVPGYLSESLGEKQGRELIIERDHLTFDPCKVSKGAHGQKVLVDELFVCIGRAEAVHHVEASNEPNRPIEYEIGVTDNLFGFSQDKSR
jgi:hypothetical protein